MGVMVSEARVDRYADTAAEAKDLIGNRSEFRD